MGNSIVIARYGVADALKTWTVVVNVVICVVVVLVVCYNVLVIHIHMDASAWTIISGVVAPVVRRTPHTVVRTIEEIVNHRSAHISGA